MTLAGRIDVGVNEISRSSVELKLDGGSLRYMINGLTAVGLCGRIYSPGHVPLWSYAFRRVGASS